MHALSVFASLLVLALTTNTNILNKNKEVKRYFSVLQKVMTYDSCCTIGNLYFLFGPYNECEISVLSKKNLSVDEINKKINNPKNTSQYLKNLRISHKVINPKDIKFVSVTEDDKVQYKMYTVIGKTKRNKEIKFIIGKEMTDNYMYLSEIYYDNKSITPE